LFESFVNRYLKHLYNERSLQCGEFHHSLTVVIRNDLHLGYKKLICKEY